MAQTAPFDTVDAETLSTTVRAVTVTMFVYGIYSVFYPLSLWVLWTRHRGAYKLYTVITTILFLLGTLSAISVIFIRLPSVSQSTYDSLYAVGAIADGLSYVFADFILLHRCYYIWNCEKRVMILPGILYICSLISGTVCFIRIQGGFDIGSNRSPESIVLFVSVILTNVIVTLMSAGRIWWMSRKAAKLYGSSLRRRCNSAVNIMLESGIFYTGCLIITSYFETKVSPNGSTADSLGSTAALWTNITPLFAGIMPTLLTVRVGLGMDSSAIRNSYQGEILINRREGTEPKDSLALSKKPDMV